LTFWSCGICVCDAKKFRIQSIVYAQTLDCWCFGSSEAFIQCLEWWTWWKRLLVPRIVAEYSVATHGTDPALCVRRKGTPCFREKVCRVFYFAIKFFFLDWLYNIRHDTEHKYINLGRLSARHGVNITRTPWSVVSSLPIPDTTYPKKEPMSPPRIRHCRLPHSFPRAPRNRRGRRPPSSEAAKMYGWTYSQRSLSTVRQAEHDTPITHRLIGAYHYDTCMHLCPYAPRRRCRGVGRGQPLTDPSPDTIPHICSTFPVLVVSCPSPFKFAQEPCFLKNNEF
jgi:hypothetical protein